MCSDGDIDNMVVHLTALILKKQINKAKGNINSVGPAKSTGLIQLI